MAPACKRKGVLSELNEWRNYAEEAPKEVSKITNHGRHINMTRFERKPGRYQSIHA